MENLRNIINGNKKEATMPYADFSAKVENVLTIVWKAMHGDPVPGVNSVRATGTETTTNVYIDGKEALKISKKDEAVFATIDEETQKLTAEDAETAETVLEAMKEYSKKKKQERPNLDMGAMFRAVAMAPIVMMEAQKRGLDIAKMTSEDIKDILESLPD